MSPCSNATFLLRKEPTMKALTLLERLNKEPYSLGIQLEDLSAESSLQQVCSAVLSTITNKSALSGSQSNTCSRTYSLDQLTTKDDSITLLSALGFKEINTAENQDSFRRGERHIVMSALEYITEQPAELLQRRCYLAKFLLPVVIPEEISGDSNTCIDANANTNALLERYQQLQIQFKSVHRQYSTLQKEAAPFAQLYEEIQQLETERTHLAHRIDDLQNQAKSRSDPGLFEKIFNATSEMRLLQEEEIRQQQQLKEAAKLFEVMNESYTDTEERLALLERCTLSSSGEELPTVDSILEYLVRNVQEYSTNVRLDLTLSHHRAKKRLTELSSNPQLTNDNLLALKLQVDRLEEDCKLKKAAIERRRASDGGVGGVDIFVTYNNEAAMTLAERKTSLENKRKELLNIEEVTKELEIKVGRSTATKTGGTEVSLIRPIDQIEAKGRGHDDTNVNDEASPKELKHKRGELLDLEDEHKIKRERYERLSLRFAADRQSLKDEVAKLEKDWMNIDSNQKELQETKEKTEGALKRLDDFDTVAAEYQKEIAHQEETLHQLHEKKRSIEEQYSYGSKQRDLFAKVESLLRIQQQELDLAPRVVGYQHSSS